MNGMSLIVKVVTRLTLGIIFLLGFYLFVFAGVSHGVGYAGGLVIALGLLLFLLAYGKEVVIKRVNYKRLALVKDLFLLLFAALTIVFIYFGNELSQLSNFKGISSLMIIFSNMSLSLVCAGCFFLIFLNLINYKREKKL